MAMGPCLCGDPYCHSCGDPSLAALEALLDELYEKLRAADYDGAVNRIREVEKQLKEEARLENERLQAEYNWWLTTQNS